MTARITLYVNGTLHSYHDVEIFTNLYAQEHGALGIVMNQPNDSPTKRRRRTRTDGPRILDRLLDPERERPFLKRLFEVAAPLLLAFLTKQLPTWLSGFDPEDPDQETG
jgi:hypothetical protein